MGRISLSKFVKRIGLFDSKKRRVVVVAVMLDDEEEHRQQCEMFLENNKSDMRSNTTSCPKGCLGVYVGEEMVRYVIPTTYLRMPEFVPVLEMIREEFGFEQTGGLCIPCDVKEFEQILRVIKDKKAKHNRR